MKKTKILCGALVPGSRVITPKPGTLIELGGPPFGRHSKTAIVDEFVAGENLKEFAPAVERHPNHYCSGGLEVIDILKAKMSPEEFRGFLLGNILKYLFRFPFKGTPVIDLKKAMKYLEWLLAVVEGEVGK